MRRWILFTVVVLGACESATVPERLANEIYEYRLPAPGLPVLRWPIGSTVQVYIAPEADPGRTALLESGFQHAADAWGAAVLYGEVQLAATSDLENADVVLLFSSTPPPISFAACPRGGGLAYTTFCVDPQNQARLAIFPLTNGGSGQVKFAVTISSVVTDGELVRRLVTHEMGHVLGIGQHSPRSTDLMYGNTLTTADPSVADRATLQLLYHTRPDITP